MADEFLDFKRRLLKRLGREAKNYVRPKISSYKGKPIHALREALEARVELDSVVVSIPHFWAVYVHDGRKAPFGPKRGSFLIWWKDPTKDPRLRGGVTPKRASQLRRLTPRQFREALRDNARAINEGREPPVVITRRVRKATPPSPFFSNEAGGGMRGFKESVGPAALKMFRRELKASMPWAFRVEKDEATGRL